MKSKNKNKNKIIPIQINNQKFNNKKCYFIFV